MKELLLIAHGSRRGSSNDEVRQLASRLSRLTGQSYSHVSCAFLELAEPLIPDGLEECIKRGATEILVLPYFLAAGRHVITDIPAEIKPVKDKYPSVKIELLPHLGASETMPAHILEHVTNS